MVCSPGRAELLEKLTKCALGLAVRYEPGLAAAAPSEGVEEQEWLVGRPFVAAFPDVDLVSALANTLRIHTIGTSEKTPCVASPNLGHCVSGKNIGCCMHSPQRHNKGNDDPTP